MKTLRSTKCGETVEITIRGYELSIRKNEAENILVD